MADADGRRRGEGGGVDGAPPVDAGRPRVCDRASPGGGGAAGARVRGGTRGARSLPALTRGGGDLGGCAGAASRVGRGGAAAGAPVARCAGLAGRV